MKLTREQLIVAKGALFFSAEELRGALPEGAKRPGVARVVQEHLDATEALYQAIAKELEPARSRPLRKRKAPADV